MLPAQTIGIKISIPIPLVNAHRQRIIKLVAIDMTNWCPQFRRNDDVLAAEIVFFDSLPEDLLRDTIGVGVGGIEEVDSRVVASF